jgi:hypothetical protein
VTSAQKRATADLAAEHRPRELLGEARICKADEQTIADAARRTEQQKAEVEVKAAIARMRRDLGILRANLRRMEIGSNHRNQLRHIHLGLKALERVIGQ